MSNLQTNNATFQANSMPIIMGLPKNSGGVSVICLGKLPKASFAGGILRRETGVERNRRETESRRFTVEMLRSRIEKNLGFEVKEISDKRGRIPGGAVRFSVHGAQVKISTLAIEREVNGAFYTSYFVWEIVVDEAFVIRPCAGRIDLELSVRKIRQAINRY